MGVQKGSIWGSRRGVQKEGPWFGSTRSWVSAVRALSEEGECEKKVNAF